MTTQQSRLLAALRMQAWGFIEAALTNWPDALGTRLRHFYWKRRLRFLGRGTRFGVGVRIYGPQWVSIGAGSVIDDYVIIVAGPLADGDRRVYRKANPQFTCREGEVAIGERVHIAPFVQLQGHGGLQIGNNLTIAAGAKVYSLSHHYRDLAGSTAPDGVWKFTGLVPPEEQALICAPTVIEDNTAIGLNAVVLPGSSVGRSSWLGAQSLLCGTLEPGVIASGAPTLAVKPRTQ